MRPTSGQTIAVPIELAHELDGLLTLLQHRYAVQIPGEIVRDVDQAIGELRALLATQIEADQ